MKRDIDKVLYVAMFFIVIAYFMIVIGDLLDKSWDGLGITTTLFLCTMLIWLLIFFFEKPFHQEYLENEIRMLYGCWIYKKIKYRRIKCIVIALAAQGTACAYSYMYDERERRCALLAFYDTETYGKELAPNTKKIIRGYYADDCLGYSYLKVSDLEKLLLKTKANIYITEDMLWSYKEELFPLLIKNADRIIVSFRTDDQGGYKHLLFMKYLSILPR